MKTKIILIFLFALTTVVFAQEEPLKEGNKTYTYTLKGISEIPVKTQITINE